MKDKIIANICCFLSYILEQTEDQQLFSLMDTLLEIFSSLYLISETEESSLNLPKDLLENIDILSIDAWEGMLIGYLIENDLDQKDPEDIGPIHVGDVLIYWTQLVQEYLNNITDSLIQGESVFYF